MENLFFWWSIFFDDLVFDLDSSSDNLGLDLFKFSVF